MLFLSYIHEIICASDFDIFEVSNHTGRFNHLIFTLVKIVLDLEGLDHGCVVFASTKYSAATPVLEIILVLLNSDLQG